MHKTENLLEVCWATNLGLDRFFGLASFCGMLERVGEDLFLITGFKDLFSVRCVCCNSAITFWFMNFIRVYQSGNICLEKRQLNASWWY